MRVLIVCHYFAPHIGGIEEVVGRQASSLAEAGHRVTVVTTRSDPRSPAREVTDWGTLHRLRAWNVVEERSEVSFPLLSPLALGQVLRLARAHDVVHLHDAFYPTSHVGGLAAWIARTPIVMTQHVALVDHPSTAVTAVQRLVYATAGRLLFRGARTIVAYNRVVRDFLLGRGVPPDRLVLTGNGIDTVHYRPPGIGDQAALRRRYGLETDVPVVLFVGRMVPKKGFDLVLAAHTPAHQTVLVGRGDVPSELADQPGVTVFGPADRHQLRDLYQLSDVFVFPAIGEVTTLVMQEAMACGLPIVTTDDPGYADTELDRGLITFVPRDPAAIRSGIADVLASPGRAAAMAVYSRWVAEQRFSWSANYPGEYRAYATAVPGPRVAGE
jgi:D-inositol-3-phosphate glycosyltransferase